MDQLRQQVKRAYRRLLLQRCLLLLPWTLTIGLATVVVAIAIDKLYPLGVVPWLWLSAGAALGALAAITWTLATRRGPLDAAIEIDRRFALKERVSSALALGQTEASTPAGDALLRDAVRRVAELDVAEKFRLTLTRWSLLPAAPVILAVLVAFLVPPWKSDQQAAAGAAPAAVRKQVQASTRQLQKKLAERAKTARKEGLKDAEQEFKKLDEALQKNLNAKNELDKKQALVKLNDLSKELEQRRGQLANSQALKQQLNDLKNLDRGPGDKFAKALKEGDLKQAVKELEKLKQELADGKLDQQAKEQLARQFEQMEERLQKMAQAQEQAKEQLKQQIAEKRADGKNNEADDLQRQLDRIERQSRAMRQMADAAKKFGQCAKCVRQGDAQDAMQQLAEMQSELGEMEQQLAESDMLSEAMEEIAQAKESMNCKKCGGQGCAACQGNGNQQGPPGMGLGKGRGQGPRPEASEATNAYDSAVKQKVQPGAAQVVDLVNGQNLKGAVRQAINQQFQEVRNAAADPLTGERLPKTSQEQAQQYFDALREGK